MAQHFAFARVLHVRSTTPNSFRIVMRRIVRWLPVLLILPICAACDHTSEPVRPANVPADAVFVRGPRVGWWQQCTWNTGSQSVHCRIWNGVGGVLEDEAFLPYDGGAAPTVDELKIASHPSFAGPDRIFLTNDRILLPESRFVELKRFVDWLQNKSQTQ
jgi:hypothetical protein